jgi:hypothetical protein
MNVIAKKVEKEFGKRQKSPKPKILDFRVLKSGKPYTKAQYKAVEKLWEEYRHRMQGIAVYLSVEKPDNMLVKTRKDLLVYEFRRECDAVCSSEDTLCDIMIDLCFKTNLSKGFVWDICGSTIVRNLLRLSGGKYELLVKDDDGDVEFSGMYFTRKELTVKEEFYM